MAASQATEDHLFKSQLLGLRDKATIVTPANSSIAGTVAVIDTESEATGGGDNDASEEMDAHMADNFDGI